MSRAGVHADGSASSEHRGTHKKHKLKMLVASAILGVALLIILLVGWLALRSSGAAATIDEGKYQAVFLTNGQVYFGNLEMLGGDYVRLTDIFYLQSQSASEDAAANPQETSQQGNAEDVQLIKLGSEIHGPQDEMIISEDKILFFENLKADGKVSRSISGYQSQK